MRVSLNDILETLPRLPARDRDKIRQRLEFLPLVDRDTADTTVEFVEMILYQAATRRIPISIPFEVIKRTNLAKLADRIKRVATETLDLYWELGLKRDSLVKLCNKVIDAAYFNIEETARDSTSLRFLLYSIVSVRDTLNRAYPHCVCREMISFLLER